MFHGFKMTEFEFEGKKSFIVFPDGKSNGKMVFKTEYWNAFPHLEIELLKRGFHLVHTNNFNRWANREDCDRKARFIKLVSEKYSLDPKCVLVGMSCGGAEAVNFAGYYPQYVSCAVLDAPVLNFLDCPAKQGERMERLWEEEFKVAYPNIRRCDIFKLDENPINRAPKLIEERIPIILLYGDQDTTVDYWQNGNLLVEAYSENMELITVIQRKHQGHHPHGLLDKSDELADLVMEKLGM